MAKLLLVDDSPTVLKVMSASLMAKGFAVTTAATGAAGLAAAARERPDAIVLDVYLPDMSGLDVLAKLRESPELNAVPVLLLTGQDDPANVIRGMELGARGFLAKHSTSPKVLIQKLQEILAARP
jgi:DNA-binding response OmpR family regulator